MIIENVKDNPFEACSSKGVEDFIANVYFNSRLYSPVSRFPKFCLHLQRHVLPTEFLCDLIAVTCNSLVSKIIYFPSIFQQLLEEWLWTM